MEIKEWRRLTVQSVLFFAVVFVGCLCFQSRLELKSEHTAMAGNKHRETEAAATQEPQEETEKYVTKSDVEESSDAYIRIAKRAVGETAGIYVSQDYRNCRIQVSIEGISADDISADDITRVKGFHAASGEVKAKSDPLLKKMTIRDGETETGQHKTVKISFKMKGIYEPELYEAEDVYYIALTKPENRYDQIVVIDAGHGGMDEGTFSQDGKYLEKQYTLLIAKRLGKLLEEDGIQVYYTRTTDEAVTKKARVDLANRLNADLLVSIHCNASSIGDQTAYGVETLYSDRGTADSGMSNERLAKLLVNQLTAVTEQRNRGALLRNDLYLLHHSEVPAAIVEIGYMSNDQDLKYIRKEEGQKEIALGVYNGIVQALEEMDEYAGTD
ncbi:MAG: N-acetylmuramoyl-L-alanine amidase [Clostridiaceae bacterium]|nr:N-acetylmuramoyl-L-alanine amidase [Clostridiaceae bacterium]